MREALDGDEHAPGISIPLIERLAALPKESRPVELDQLIDSAVQAYSHDPFSLDGVLGIRLRMAGADVDRRRETSRAIVEVWKQAAADADPLVAHRHLERALQVAGAAGLTDEVETLRVCMQELSRQDPGFEKISTAVEIPTALFEAFHAQFFEQEDVVWRLRRFSVYCPMREDEDQVEQKVRELMQRAPLGFLATRILFNSQNLPIKHIEGQDQHLAQGIIDHDTRAIVYWGLSATQGVTA